MVTIKDKEQCCGCAGCSQSCPVGAIRMESDAEGFLYPVANPDICIECGLCHSVCPMSITEHGDKLLVAIHAYKNPVDEVRLRSSSGGLFSKLATAILNRGGVVCGAVYDTPLIVKHIVIDSVEQLPLLCGSKYLQSEIGDSYVQVRTILESGREVLFSGTPCQVAGLRRFLGKDYANLLLVDIICHGVPSPEVWRACLSESLQKSGVDMEYRASGVNFRDKRNGWKHYGVSLTVKHFNGTLKDIYEPASRNTFMKGFLNDLYLRPSCYSCMFKAGESDSDITLGDFWGVEKVNPLFDDDKGVSLVIINSHKGKEAFTANTEDCIDVLLDDVAKYNPSYFQSAVRPKERDEFFKEFLGARGTTISLIERLVKQRSSGFKNRIITVLRRVGLYDTVKRFSNKLKQL